MMNKNDLNKLIEEKGVDFVLKNLGFMLSDEQKQEIEFKRTAVDHDRAYLYVKRNEFMKLTAKQKEIVVGAILKGGGGFVWQLLDEDYINLKPRQKKIAIDKLINNGSGHSVFVKFHQTMNREQKQRAVENVVENNESGEDLFDLFIHYHALLTPKQRDIVLGGSLRTNRGYALLTRYPSLLTKKQRKVVIHHLETGEVKWNFSEEKNNGKQEF